MARAKLPIGAAGAWAGAPVHVYVGRSAETAAWGSPSNNPYMPFVFPHAIAAELRSLTAGQGSFEMAFVRYDVVPSNVAQKVIAEAAKQATADADE